MVSLGVVSCWRSYSVALCSMASSGVLSPSFTIFTLYWQLSSVGLQLSVGCVHVNSGLLMLTFVTLSIDIGSLSSVAMGVRKVGACAM